MPDYAVRNTETGDVRIVTAARPATALAHVTTPLFSVTLATAQDGIDAGRQGRRVEVAGEEPQPMLQFDGGPKVAGVIPGTDADSGAPASRVDGGADSAPRFDTTDQQEAEDR